MVISLGGDMEYLKSFLVTAVLVIIIVSGLACLSFIYYNYHEIIYNYLPWIAWGCAGLGAFVMTWGAVHEILNE